MKKSTLTAAGTIGAIFLLALVAIAYEAATSTTLAQDNEESFDSEDTPQSPTI